MRDNLSIVITMIVFVILIVIFPLYNYFERQDDMSYNLVLKATTNFVDEVINTGYIDQDMYDKFVSKLANTGNLYDIDIEAHKKVYTKDPNNLGSDTFIEQYQIDYTKDIFDLKTGIAQSNSSQSLEKTDDKVLKNNIYYLNTGDQIYVKLKNSSTTMAGAIFNIIVPASTDKRITVNYGGVIKNNAWKNVPINAVYQNGIIADVKVVSEGTNSDIEGLPTFSKGNELKVHVNLTNLQQDANLARITENMRSNISLIGLTSEFEPTRVEMLSGLTIPTWEVTFKIPDNVETIGDYAVCQIKLKTGFIGEVFYEEVFSNKIAIKK